MLGIAFSWFKGIVEEEECAYPVHPQKPNIGKDATEGVKARISNIDNGKDATEGVKARTSTSDRGKEKVSQDATEGVEARTSTVESDYNSEFDINDDNDYHSDKLVDYLSPGEEELIKLRNRMKADREAKDKAKANPISKINEPNDENIIPADNVRGRPRKNQSVINLEDVDVGVRGPVRVEGADGSKRGVGGSKEGAGASGSKRKAVSSDETQKRQGKKKVGTSEFDKWFGLQDEPKHTQDVRVQTKDKPVQTQDEDQVEQTQKQAETDLTHVEQTQEQTQDQVQPR
nr:squalene cyclase [Tanacetum cinerariifolium]